MKISIGFAVASTVLLLVEISHGFVVTPTRTATTTTSIKVSTSSPGPFFGGDYKLDDWSSKPVPKSVSTEPVATRNVSKRERQKMKDVIIPPNYFLTYALIILGIAIMGYHPSYATDGSPSLIGIFGGCFHILFGTLLGVQTARVRCVFEKDAFEFYNIQGKGLDLENGDAKLVRKPSNYVAGTDNRWTYDSITNYDFFPSLEYPVICYFKETETDESQWNKWFAAFDSYGRGQPHFFPGICNVHKFKEQMELRGVKRKRIPTFGDDKIQRQNK